MVPNSVNIAVEVAAILLTAFIIARAFPLLKEENKRLPMVLFIFAVVSLMLSLSYWLLYSFMRPESRMPFAANEIGEIAWFLLLSGVLELIFRDSRIPAKKEIACTYIFATASVALWIGWSGEWIQDIISGAAFGYFLCVCTRSLKQSGALRRNEWIMLGVSCGLLIICQAGTFFVSESVKRPLDYFCYVLMFAVLIWLLVKRIGMANSEKDPKATLAMSFAFCAFGFSTLYMSSGWFYMAALIFCLAALPLMLISLRRDVMT